MLRILPAVFTAATLCVSIGAQAAEIITVLPTDTARVAHDKLVAAAERACRTAIAADRFGGEFDPLDECIAASVRSARRVTQAMVASSAK
jgi:hypothetical protein